MKPQSYNHVLAKLATGPLYSEDKDLWSELHREVDRVRLHYRDMGLDLVIRETDGFAFLRQHEEDPDGTSPPAIPRILRRRQLSYPQTILLIMLRERLLAHQQTPEAELHLFVDLPELVTLMRPFFPDRLNEKKLYDDVNRLVSQFEEWKLLRLLRDTTEPRWRVEPIIKARLPAEEVRALREKLIQLTGAETSDEPMPELTETAEESEKHV